MSPSTEKLSLKWNDFQENLCISVKELKESIDFCDVTLVCDEDGKIEAHKVILSGWSPFFKNILTKNVHPHPLIFLRGLKFSELKYLISFMYDGEVSMAAEEVNMFLSIAEEFQLKGLMEKNIENQPNQPNPCRQEAKSNEKKKSNGDHSGNDGVADRIPRNKYSQGLKTNRSDKEGHNMLDTMKQEIPVEKVNHYEKEDVESSITEDLDEVETTATVDRSYLVTIPENSSLDETISTLMEAQDGQWACNLCGKQMKRKKDMMNHTEVHIGGITHPCSSCGKAFRQEFLNIHVYPTDISFCY